MDSGTRKGPELWEGRNKARWLILKPFRLNSSKFPKLNQGRWWRERERERENMKETQNKPRKPSATAASLLVAICCYFLLDLSALHSRFWSEVRVPDGLGAGSTLLLTRPEGVEQWLGSSWFIMVPLCSIISIPVGNTNDTHVSATFYWFSIFTSRPEGRWRDNRNSFRRLLYPLPCLKLIHCRLFPPCQSQSTSVGEPYTWTLENWGGPWLLLGRQYWGRSCMIQLVHRVFIWSKPVFEEGIIRFGYRVDMLGTRVHRRKRFFAAWFVCWLATILYNYGFFTDHSTGTSKPTRHFVNNTAEQPEQSLEFVSILPGFSLWSRLLWVLHNLPMRFLQSARRCYWR